MYLNDTRRGNDSFPLHKSGEWTRHSKSQSMVNIDTTESAQPHFNLFLPFLLFFVLSCVWVAWESEKQMITFDKTKSSPFPPSTTGLNRKRQWKRQAEVRKREHCVFSKGFSHSLCLARECETLGLLQSTESITLVWEGKSLSSSVGSETFFSKHEKRQHMHNTNNMRRKSWWVERLLSPRGKVNRAVD